MAYHLSIFVENRPGKLEKITKVLADNGINIRAISVASAGEFGVVKLLVNEGDRAFAALREQNITVSKRRILVILLPDSPGAMYDLLVVLSEKNINLEDCYGFVVERKKQAAVVIEAEKYPLAEGVLKEKGYKLLSDQELAAI
ncbi:MAG TPA: ACT domain-containing protein [Firmicutes bacterium]|nr:ACT domain-containing protein [Bacillota bacterium]